MTLYAARLPPPSFDNLGMVSRTVRETRETREATGAGTAPRVTIASTPSRAASRSSLVGTLGSSGRSGSRRRPVIRANRSLSSMVSILTQPSQRPPVISAMSGTLSEPARSALRGPAQIKRAAGDLWVLTLNAVQVFPGLADLGLQRADGGGHVVQRLDLERVNRIHRGVDVREGGLQLWQPDRGRGGLLLDRHGVVLEHLRGALDHRRRGGVQGGDLVEHELLVAESLGHHDGSAQRRDRRGGSAVDALHQLDVVLDDDVDGQVVLDRHGQLGQQVLDRKSVV